MLLERFESGWSMLSWNGVTEQECASVNWFVCAHKNEGLTLKHVGLLYLPVPVNTASYMQPLEQGIIYCMKQAQWWHIVHFLLEETERDAPTEEVRNWNMCILYNQQDATYTMFFIIISAVHVSGSFSAHHQELIKLYLQP